MDNQNPNPPTVSQGKTLGRPTKIDEAHVRLLLSGLQNGLSVRKACIYAGVSKTAFYDRCKIDALFLDAMERAQNNLLELAGDRINSIIRNGADRDAGPLAWKVFERGMPEQYGQKAPIVDNSKKQTNNFFVLNNEQISNIGQQPDIEAADPTELLEALEETPTVDVSAEEEGTPSIHREEISHFDPDDSDLQ